MKILVHCILLLTGLTANAQLPDMKEILLMIPDSVFRYCPGLCESNTFSKEEREALFTDSDSKIFRNDACSDSLHELQFSGGDIVTVQLKYWVRSEKEIFIAIIESNCDFVMCSQNNSFYILKKGKLKPSTLDYFTIPMKHFFSSDKLTECGINPESGCKEYTLSIENETVSVHFQSEYTESELAGMDGKYVCLENSERQNEAVFYSFDGKKLALKIRSIN